MKTKDAVKYLLSYGIGVNGSNPPAYLIHNLLDDKGYITTFENLYDKTRIGARSLKLSLPFSITQSMMPGKLYAMTSVETDSANGGIENAEEFFNYRIMEYDQEERRWDDYSINKMTINDLLTKGIDVSKEKSIFTMRII